MAPTPPEAPRAALTDSPLFWVVVFGTMALFAAIVVAPKYAQRQGRLERMYRSRQLTATTGQAGTPASPTDDAPGTAASSDDSEWPWYQPMPVTSLLPLGLFLATIVGLTLAGAVTVRTLRRRRDQPGNAP